MYTLGILLVITNIVSYILHLIVQLFSKDYLKNILLPAIDNVNCLTKIYSLSFLANSSFVQDNNMPN